MQKRYLALTALLWLPCIQARQDRLSCGTHADNWREEVQLHRSSQRRAAADSRKAGFAAFSADSSAGAADVLPDIGNIAILSDSDGVVARRNPFRLNGRTVRFLPSPGSIKYRFEVADDTYDSSAASGGSILAGITDDDMREIALPFPFPFFGHQYTSIFVNSDGNASFGAGDDLSADRSLGRFTSGPPRIAPMFTDLDPSHASTGITVNSTANRFVVSWVDVPEYRDSGRGPLQTFQMRLYPDGRIELAFSGTTTDEAVTGITPGHLQGAASIVSFLNDPSDEYGSTVAERFTNIEQVDMFAAAQRFYLNHDDAYDYLVVYNNLGVQVGTSTVASEVTVRNDRTGYGDPKVDVGEQTGSARRLQAFLNMGPLDQYPRSPDGRVPARLSVGDTPVTVLAHEAGHLFLAYASVEDPTGPNEFPMLGSQMAHWAFTFNSEASVLEGNRIVDNGPGTNPRFQTTAAVEGYSPLDQYLMGLRAADEVPDTFYVANARGNQVSGLPHVGATFNGDRRDVRITDLIGAAGRRTPDHTVAQRRFRFAFILITAAGQEPSPEDVSRIEGYRTAFEAFFNKASSARAVADTTLKRAVQISTAPAAGVVAGATGTATVSIDHPAESPLTILLNTQNGNTSVPRSVTISPGEMQTSFQLAGVREGVEELIAEPGDPRYETVASRIQVAAPDSLRFNVVSGDNQTAVPGVPLTQPVRLRVTDVNELPYAGVQVQATLIGGGVLDRPDAVTDSKGIAEFQWRPGPGPRNELRVSGPGQASITVAALSKPSITSEAVGNAASFRPGLTPGGIATLFGLNLGGSTAKVTINAEPAQVFYASNSQINFLVPGGVPTGTAELMVQNVAGTSGVLQVPVQAVQPGIFFDSTSGYGAIVVAGKSEITSTRPAGRGDVVEIYMTGLGRLDNDSRTVERPGVVLGGVPAEVIYSGSAPGFPGLYQINARVPLTVGTGRQAAIVSVNGIDSNQAAIEIR
jgi:uncharacterized protein (TIGR03437 family)